MSKGQLPLTNWSDLQLTMLAILALLFGGC